MNVDLGQASIKKYVSNDPLVLKESTTLSVNITLLATGGVTAFFILATAVVVMTRVRMKGAEQTEGKYRDFYFHHTIPVRLKFTRICAPYLNVADWFHPVIYALLTNCAICMKRNKCD